MELLRLSRGSLPQNKEIDFSIGRGYLVHVLGLYALSSVIKLKIDSCTGNKQASTRLAGLVGTMGIDSAPLLPQSQKLQM
jgi:hypothetical protein